MSQASEFAAQCAARPQLDFDMLQAWVEGNADARIGVARNGTITEVHLDPAQAIALGAWLVQVYGEPPRGEKGDA